jgi:membrane protein DedA with SNARE-associated domain/rhodanese-related sulfurtransferase
VGLIAMHNSLIDFLQRYGYWLLFANVLLEQGGLPLPTTPLLLTMGALAGLGKFSLSLSVLIAVAACICADTTWYHLGKSRGNAILSFLCRVSLEPDSCASTTYRRFEKWGAPSLLVAKFVPGLNAAAAPMAGLTRLPLVWFLVFDICGALLYSAATLGIGFVLHNQLELVIDRFGRYGSSAAATIFTLLGLYLAWKYYQRRQFIRKLRMARILPDELRDLIDLRQVLTIIDLRNARELREGGHKLPGAIWIDPKNIDNEKDKIPPNEEVVLYCSCPNEAASARAALMLLRRGALRVRPLMGGFDEWVRRGFPLETVELARAQGQTNLE